ncbi:NAD-dependent epimerase/dehydratase family protein [Streptomyces xiaopingdaonensis]|uniref:NAD-dependent epimerase/dehydratase family protein n=1 Tax=Streptomyces xiaopingdaonensis TaxID=1565415 RepID=UPI0002DE94EF|nr:NAD-dependent epimerase/dehydratase family protein [Streptomyces xiaopingdaonensis]
MNSAPTGVRSEHPGTVLVAGGTGFVGRAVVRELVAVRARSRTAPRVRVLARRPPRREAVPGDGVEYVSGDLTAPETLAAACSGATALVHAASYVGRDRARCDAVNHRGTRTLIDAADRAGIRRVLYVSTAAVYGAGPHRGAAEGELAPSPQSAASASRLAAEEAVRAAGGVVLRPHLILGKGDKWVLPTLIRLLERVPSWGGTALSYSSTIAVEELARLVRALVQQPVTGQGEVYHAAHPRPVQMRSLVLALSRLLGSGRPRGGPPREVHRESVGRALPELTAHQYALLTQDHWYDSSRVWRLCGLEPGPDVTERLAGYVDRDDRRVNCRAG